MKFIFENNESKSLGRKIPSIWNKSESKILKEIYKITNLSIKPDEITCTIDSATNEGLYGYDNITLGIKNGISEDDILMVTTHELFHIFYWKKLKEMKLSKGKLGKETKEEWQLSEITAYLIIREKNLMKIWPNAQVYLYPELKELYGKVIKYWNKDFEKFLVDSYKIIR